MTPDLASRDAVIWDYDGVKYDDKAISNHTDLCEQACADAGHALLPELSYAEALELGRKSYDRYGDCLGAHLDWATQNGRNPQEFRQQLFELYHRNLLNHIRSGHSHMFDPVPDTIIEFSRRPHIRHGIATHSFVDGFVRPLLNQSRLLGFFNEAAMIGMDMVGFARKSQDVASLNLALSRLNASPETAIFVEDNLKNLACAKRLLPELVTVFMHHGRPLEPKPLFVDFQFTNNRELMQAINSSTPRVFYSLP